MNFFKVEIQAELDELEEDETTRDHEAVFEMDPFDAVVGQESGDSDSEVGEDDDEFDNLSELSSDAGDMDDENVLEDTSSPIEHVNRMVKKLDIILKLLFDHFHRTHVVVLHPDYPGPKLDPGLPLSLPLSDTLDSPRIPPYVPLTPEARKSISRAQFHTLLSIFERTIIRTFKSRFTQFLVFWYSSLDTEFSDLFQGLLVSKALLELNQPAVTRAAAASYIGSLVSRAQFIDREGARRVTGVLCEFLRSHLDSFDSMVRLGKTLPGHAHHTIFYAVTQALFLIFCFRWRDLLDDYEDEDDLIGGQHGKKKWIPDLDVIQRVITSPLNPLKVFLAFLSASCCLTIMW